MSRRVISLRSTGHTGAVVGRHCGCLMRTLERTYPAVDQKPRDDEVEVFGLSHAGRVRPINEDHFLLATIHKRVQILQTNLSPAEPLPIGEERLAVIAMVADGVGGADAGEEASAK